MTVLDALLLGLVQGLTEFLPISSSGHLVLAERLLGVDAPGVVVEVALHVATLAAVVIVYRMRVLEVARGVVTGDGDALRFVGLILVASVPAGVVGLVFEDAITRAFGSLLVVGIALVTTGLMLFMTRGRVGARALPGFGAAAMIGVAQALAIIPGISRSGSTIAAALWLDVDAVKAAEFSFLMSLVAISGAAVLQLPDVGAVADDVGALPLAVAFIAALLSGVAAIKLLVRILRSQSFHRFAPYCWVVGAATIGWTILA